MMRPRKTLREKIEARIAREKQADVFLHLYFASLDQARTAGEHLVVQERGGLAYSVFRVRTLTVI